MMRFRRGRGYRRKRHGANLLPFNDCQDPMVIKANSDCLNPTTIMFDLAYMQGQEGGGAPDESLRKGLMFLGAVFHYNYAATLPDLPQGSGVAVGMELRSAIVKLQYNPTTGVPSFVPNLFSSDQQRMGDILWRGHDMLFHSDSINGMTMSGTSGGIQQAGRLPERIKTKRRLLWNDRLYWVVNGTNPLVEIPENANDIVIALSIFGAVAVRSFQK